jgi:hypothetical protein
MMTGTATIEVDRADRGDLPQREVGILPLQINYQLAHHPRQGAGMVFALGFGRTEEAEQALPIKGIRDAPQRMLGQAGFLGALLSREAEKNNRADSLIQALFRGTTPLLDQVVVVGALASFPFRLGHRLASRAACRFGGYCSTRRKRAPGGGCIRRSECPDLSTITVEVCDYKNQLFVPLLPNASTYRLSSYSHALERLAPMCHTAKMAESDP